MGSIVRFERPRPVIRHRRAKIAEEHESREARHSLFILIGAFFVTATVMCVVVVAMVSSTWTDVLLMSAFVLVFALLKIVLANALIYTMLRYDETSVDVNARSRALASYPRVAAFSQPPAVRGRHIRSLETNKTRGR
jgi:protein-S-isoprenylcysteine O-methyltransferase Ste14